VIRLGEKHAALDAKVMAALAKHGQLRPTQLVTITGAGHRDVDHALDRLRRAGKIVFVSAVAGWKIK
jgi:hypothetical protein